MRVLITLIFTSFFSFMLYAQERVIEGTVTDLNNNPIEGVTVQLEGSEISTQTDSEGKYTIKVPSDKFTTLNFSYSGKENASASIGVYDTIDITMSDPGEDVWSMSLDDLLNMEVVTASKSGEKLSDAPGVLSVYTSNELERFGGKTLYEILARIPGLSQSTGYFPDKSIISIRGDQASAISSHVLYLINGRPVREVHEGGISTDLLNTFPVGIIERIEVIKGPGSVLYGSNAFSGVVNIITKKSEENTVEAEALAGSEGAHGVSATFHAKVSDLKLSGAVNYLRQPSFEYTRNTPASDTVQGGAPLDLVTNPVPIETEIEKHGIGAFMKAEYKGLSISSSIFDYNTSYFIRQHNSVENPFKSSTNLGYDTEITDFWRADINASYTLTSLDVTAYPNVRREDQEIVAELTNFFAIRNNLNLSLGGLFNKRSGDEVLTSIDKEIANADVNSFGVYSQLDYKPIKNLKLIGGVQVNIVENIDPNAVPRFGVIYYPIEKLNIKAIYAEAFRAPSILELGLNHPALQGNPDLESENVANTDISATYNAERWQVGASYFYTKYTKLIIPDRSTTPGTYQNLGKLTIQGFEVESKFYATDNFFISASFIHQNNEDQNGVENISDLPYNQAKAGLSYKWDNGFNVSVFNSFYDKIEIREGIADPFNPANEATYLLDLYFKFDAHTFFGWKSKLSFFAEANNVLDQAMWLPNKGASSPGNWPQYTGTEFFCGIKAGL